MQTWVAGTQAFVSGVDEIKKLM